MPVERTPGTLEGPLFGATGAGREPVHDPSLWFTVGPGNEMEKQGEWDAACRHRRANDTGGAPPGSDLGVTFEEMALPPPKIGRLPPSDVHRSGAVTYLKKIDRQKVYPMQGRWKHVLRRFPKQLQVVYLHAASALELHWEHC